MTCAPIYKQLAAVLVCLLGMVSLPSYAEGFSTFNDQSRQLAEHAIVSAGNLSVRTQRQTNYDTWASQPKTMYQLNGVCFYLDRTGLSGVAGLLLVDKFKNTSVAVFRQEISSISVEMFPITALDCTAISMKEMQDSQRDVQQMVNEAKRMEQQNKELLRQLKQMQQQRQGQQ